MNQRKQSKVVIMNDDKDDTNSTDIAVRGILAFIALTVCYAYFVYELTRMTNV